MMNLNRFQELCDKFLNIFVVINNLEDETIRRIFTVKYDKRGPFESNFNALG